MKINTYQELAIRVMDERKKQGLSQSEVAARVGLNQKTISLFESHPERTKIASLIKILSALGMELHIMSQDKEKSTKQWNEEW